MYKWKWQVNFRCNWNVWYTWYIWLSCYNGYWKSVWFIRSSFLLFVFKKFGFDENFIHWINKQESCVINAGFTTRYFNLEKGARQGDPISAYLFILTLEVLFELIKNNDDIRGITIFNHAFLYTAFADDSSFFLNDLISISNLIDTFKVFSLSSGLKANFSKWEIAELGSLKGVLLRGRFKIY